MSDTSSAVDYTGTFEYSVDGKNRISVPPRFRDAFASGGFISLRSDHIAMFDRSGWEAHLDGLRRLLADGQLPRKTFNIVLGVTEEIAPDGQGRFGLGRLRDLHGIEQRVTLVGLDNCLGIYRPENAPGVVVSELFQALDVLDGMPQ